MLSLRPATERDLGFLVELRNDPESVRFSKRGVLSAGQIARDYLERSDKRAVVVTRNDERLGYAAFEVLGPGIAEISIALAPTRRGLGLARPLIEAASSHAIEELGFEAVRAEIDPTNVASQRSFVGAGYRRVPAVGQTESLECYEFRDAWPRSEAALAPAREPARRPPGPPPRG